MGDTDKGSPVAAPPAVTLKQLSVVCGARSVVMAWAVAIIVVIGIGVPTAGWLISRRRGMQRQVSASGLGPPSDAVDKWLIETYRLPALQRWQVRNAVVYGREVADPVLRCAAHDLAGCTLPGELTPGRGLRIGGVAMVAEGAAGMILGIAMVAAIGGLGVDAAALIPVLFGVRWMAKGAATLRIVQQGATRARQLNA